jgi:Zn-dependent protease
MAGARVKACVRSADTAPRAARINCKMEPFQSVDEPPARRPLPYLQPSEPPVWPPAEDTAQTWPPAEPRRPSWLRRRLGPLIAAIAALAAKFKAILLLLPKIKLVSTAGTMLVSIAAYALLWGFPFALGFVILLLVHEMGHVVALRREGVKASAPMFIPFLGAVIMSRSLGKDALAEAKVGLAGPILGSIGAAACIIVYHATGNELWRALAFTGFFLNLFNLLPVVPLDGGRAMAAMAPWMWIVGFAALIPLVVVFSNPIMFIILFFAGLETYKRFQLKRQGGAVQEAYYKVKPVDRVLVAGVYLSLIALLVVGMHATNLPRTIA